MFKRKWQQLAGKVKTAVPRKLTLVFDKSKLTAKEELIRRPSFAITHPSYLSVEPEVYVGTSVNISTPAVSGFENTGVVFKQGSYIHAGSQLEIFPGAKMEVGEGAKIGQGSFLLGDIHLAPYAALAPRVFMSSGKFGDKSESKYWLRRDRMAWYELKTSTNPSERIYIGEDAVIDYNTYVRAGVYIGKGANIGANSVVLKDVPPFSTQMGSPAREFSRRITFSPPALLTAKEQSHWPYFYEGFYFQKVEWEKSLREGVLWMRPYSALIVQSIPATHLRLIGSAENLPCKAEVKINGIFIGEVTPRSGVFDIELDIPAIAMGEQAKRTLPSVLRGFHQVEINRTNGDRMGLSSLEIR